MYAIVSVVGHPKRKEIFGEDEVLGSFFYLSVTLSESYAFAKITIFIFLPFVWFLVYIMVHGILHFFFMVFWSTVCVAGLQGLR